MNSIIDLFLGDFPNFTAVPMASMYTHFFFYKKIIFMPEAHFS